MIKGKSRRDNVRASLERISMDVERAARGRRVIIKPNFVSTKIGLASTHIDAVRGVLDFLSTIDCEEVVIAEGACGDTPEGFSNFGYDALTREYCVDLVDLNIGPSEPFTILDSMGEPFDVKVSSFLLGSDKCLISTAMLKTHDSVVATMTLKNMAMGAVLMGDKVKVHQGYRYINRNISSLAEYFWPDVAIIDGLVGMEGEGPIDGDPIEVGVALAGTDPLSVDRIGAEIMGVDFSNIGYLNLLVQKGLGEAELDSIEIDGADARQCRRAFKLHSNVEKQYAWR